MHLRQIVLILCGAVLVGACDPGGVANPDLSTVQGIDRPLVNVYEEEWYPTNPDGSPDYGATATAERAWAEATIAWGQIVTGTIRAGFSYMGSRAEIAIIPDVKRNDGEEVHSLHPGTLREFGPSGSAIIAASHTWQTTIPEAVCKTSLGGAVDFRAWMYAAPIRWGERWTSGTIPTTTAGSVCVRPIVTISPSGPITVEGGTNQTFSVGQLSSGSGTIKAYQWTVDGKVVGSWNTWTGPFTQGSHTVTLTVTNTARLSGSASVAVTATETRTDTTTSPPTSPPTNDDGGGGGGGTRTCYTMDIDHYWYYPDSDTYEYRYTETYSWCEDGEYET